ncbi:hypothetical protein VNO77_19005 [Canavalia gladiata]|uniref:Uncharacterized protein n=1 Tax=Canavalia gladiata TaxID=3824 RepID=A0AAN9LQK3_CANGL
MVARDQSEDSMEPSRVFRFLYLCDLLFFSMDPERNLPRESDSNMGREKPSNQIGNHSRSLDGIGGLSNPQETTEYASQILFPKGFVDESAELCRLGDSASSVLRLGHPSDWIRTLAGLGLGISSLSLANKNLNMAWKIGNHDPDLRTDLAAMIGLDSGLKGLSSLYVHQGLFQRGKALGTILTSFLNPSVFYPDQERVSDNSRFKMKVSKNHEHFSLHSKIGTSSVRRRSWEGKCEDLSLCSAKRSTIVREVWPEVQELLERIHGT